MPDTYVRVSKPITDERNSITATAYFRDGDSASAPTTASYRVDCLTTGTNIEGWTTLTPATEISIAIVSNSNRIVSNSNRFEKKQLTVAANRGETTETRDTVVWKVKNIRGFEG